MKNNNKYYNQGKTGPEGLRIYHRGYDPEASLGVSGR